MGKQKPIKRISEKKQEDYNRRARLEYGPDRVNQSIKLWNSYGKEKQDDIMREGGQVYTDLVEVMKKGLPPNSQEVFAVMERWHAHIYYFYEPTLEIMRGLGDTYANNPEFRTFFEKIHKKLPDYLSAAVVDYVDELETRELQTMIAADDTTQHARLSE